MCDMMAAVDDSAVGLATWIATAFALMAKRDQPAAAPMGD
jgi:hypothetical protein